MPTPSVADGRDAAVAGVLLVTLWYGGTSNGVALVVESLAQSLHRAGVPVVVLELVGDGWLPRTRRGTAGEEIVSVCIRDPGAATTPPRRLAARVRTAIADLVIRRAIRRRTLGVAHFHCGFAESAGRNLPVRRTNRAHDSQRRSRELSPRGRRAAIGRRLRRRHRRPVRGESHSADGRGRAPPRPRDRARPLARAPRGDRRTWYRAYGPPVARRAARADPFGLVVVEAMVCGTAVVATEVGGIPEIGARTGGVTLVPPDNPAALADAIVTLLDDPVRRETSATNARANARRAFGAETIRDEYIDAYRVAVGMDGTMTPG